jgi:hypothetical protein
MKRDLLITLAGDSLLFAGGLYATLLGFRVIGKKPGVSAQHDDWYKRWGRNLKILGPMLMVFAVFSTTLAVFQYRFAARSIVWKRYATSDGVCSAEFPGVPTVDSTTQRIHLTRENGAAYYMLSYATIPLDAPEMTTAELLNASREGGSDLGEELGTTFQFVRERDVVVADRSGREWEFAAENSTLLVRAFIRERRIYRMAVMLPKEKRADEMAQRFLNSIRIEKPDD